MNEASIKGVFEAIDNFLSRASIEFVDNVAVWIFAGNKIQDCSDRIGHMHGGICLGGFRRSANNRDHTSVNGI